MGLQKQVIEQMKVAMKAKDTVALTALRALKSAFMIANTQTGTATEISEEEALKIIQKQVKQRKDSAAVFTEQKRDDLAKPELEEATVLEQFLPEALSEEEIAKVVAEVIAKTKATGMKDMGKVMGMASKELAGKADGTTISAIIKKTLA
ncbi:GatB/YqeY domain-containing protein [Tenacibaculum finnmarkense]|uniref:GatB/YqeY domain-containing protein n=1 Tax=Tenacibaculum finnmarkense TaxID=2781243 RepID=UPI00187B1693|nr:GatB/YqeY domain-containing protein [Tenacibaculum finnmarkense]MBE7646077.1 GatB/YqeY domain-containing protein [Tenacibaculum finnmarkense genomovar ulcerans]MCD8422953.1 GatB/YqeY domain-containing protein [Tenacibaculum finnmarkense genomovar ulcerans]MCG8238958.1 GatB/YqeY domain-containing protein [Tenacibaculum finnmarkense genomovar ulcerans]